MKEFDGAPLAIEQKVTKEHQKHKFMANMVHQRGLTLWEYDEKTKQIAPAKIEYVQMSFEQEHHSRLQAEAAVVAHTATVKHKKVIYRKDCMYFEALNMKNAMKKIEKMLKGT